MIKPPKLATRNYKIKTWVSRGPLKLKPTQVHKPKKTYDRKKEKRSIEKQIKIAAD